MVARLALRLGVALVGLAFPIWAFSQSLPVPSNPGPSGITFTDDQNVWFGVGAVLAFALGFIGGQQR